MDRLKNRTQFIPNGFWFVDAPISHEPLGNLAWDFETLCRNVQARRQQNPRFNLPTDLNAIRNEVDAQNAYRMRRMKGAESYIAAGPDPGGSFPNPAASPKTSRFGVVGGVKHVAAGVGVLLDWLGSGAQPVPAEMANRRAAVCKVCPQNQAGDIFAYFTQPVAEKIRQQLQIRKELTLATPDDADLHICRACHCPLKLKVHVPLAHIAEHQAEETLEKLDAKCWILTELKP